MSCSPPTTNLTNPDNLFTKHSSSSFFFGKNFGGLAPQTELYTCALPVSILLYSIVYAFAYHLIIDCQMFENILTSLEIFIVFSTEVEA